ncbi:ubiquinone biosynthesis regulatory protein kinase UbiB [Aliikangiella marina]|uniref:Ubiquinone biosynthesis regulatory protein kinase UbiB n=1 Tax=Aliikangiella marina TaxID=1712262 RepID=A0A545TBT6_9GAMM|nr:ubiquinone biosynthesis regulatory protein kinase UbiB [Aliikangiella marina]TQV74656.1 ubiquinone biosynthesis regulatory protein kinase UbiB [Aliikangiella marina]
MTSLLTLRRAFVINRILVRHGLEEFLAPTPLSKITRLLKLFALSSNNHKSLNRGERLNQALTELGPIFVKLGQMLSTRRDLLPPDIADELAKLQDKVTPFTSEVAVATVEKQLGCPIGEIFSHFDPTPMASASVAQVHSATLLNGDEVVVKIIRPGITRKIKADLKLLHLLAGWFEKYSSTGRRLHAKTVIKDYEATLFNELDLRIEAANTSQLRHNFENNRILYVPSVYWDLCRERVMVQEKIYGIPIGDVEALKAANVDMRLLAHRGVEIFFTQVFKHSYFHADMHPGNIFVDVSNPADPTYIGIDCGIMGTLNESDKRYLGENFIAFFNRDYRRVAELHIKSGWIAPHFSAEEFETAIRTACEPIFGKSLDEISFGHFMIQLFQTARRFEMEVQPQLVLLQKTLLYIEGLGRQLYPQLDLWETAQPFLNEWVAMTYGPRAIFKKIKNKFPEWLEQLPDMPEKVATLLEHSIQQEEKQSELVKSIEVLKDSQNKSSGRLKWALLGLALVLVSLLDQPIWLASDGIKQILLSLSLASFVVSFRA